MAYTAAAWLGFGEALAAVAGALTGLLFVAAVPGQADRLTAAGFINLAGLAVVLGVTPQTRRARG
jgi:hypothetical protein